MSDTTPDPLKPARSDVPEGSELMSFQCPACQTTHQVLLVHVGRSRPCPACGEQVEIRPTVTTGFKRPAIRTVRPPPSVTPPVSAGSPSNQVKTAPPVPEAAATSRGTRSKLLLLTVIGLVAGIGGGWMVFHKLRARQPLSGLPTARNSVSTADTAIADAERWRSQLVFVLQRWESAEMAQEQIVRDLQISEEDFRKRGMITAADKARQAIAAARQSIEENREKAIDILAGLAKDRRQSPDSLQRVLSNALNSTELSMSFKSRSILRIIEAALNDLPSDPSADRRHFLAAWEKYFEEIR